MTVKELFDSIHYTDDKWPGLDELPAHEDGRPGWDIPETEDDPDDEDIEEIVTEGPVNRLGQEDV